MIRLTTLLTAVLLLTTGTTSADEVNDRIRALFAERAPGVAIDSIEPSPVPGIYEVVFGTQLLYITGDGQLAFQGRLLDLESGRDLSEPVVGKIRLNMLEAVPEAEMVIFEPAGEVRHTLTTFTDIDCPYCRKLHEEMPQLNAAGIRVRYMLYPRAGVNSESYAKAVDVWCADDRNEAMTLAKSGRPLERRDCDNPVQAHMELAQQLGLSGTPFTITDTGEEIAGYAPFDVLVQRLDAAKAAVMAKSASTN